MSGRGFIANHHFQSLWDWIEYTTVLLRTIAYSLGAYCWARVGRFGRSVPNAALHRTEEVFVERYFSERPVDRDSK